MGHGAVVRPCRSRLLPAASTFAAGCVPRLENWLTAGLSTPTSLPALRALPAAQVVLGYIHPGEEPGEGLEVSEGEESSAGESCSSEEEHEEEEKEARGQWQAGVCDDRGSGRPDDPGPSAGALLAAVGGPAQGAGQEGGAKQQADPKALLEAQQGSSRLPGEPRAAARQAAAAAAAGEAPPPARPGTGTASNSQGPLGSKAAGLSHAAGPAEPSFPRQKRGSTSAAEAGPAKGAGLSGAWRLVARGGCMCDAVPYRRVQRLHARSVTQGRLPQPGASEAPPAKHAVCLIGPARSNQWQLTSLPPADAEGKRAGGPAALARPTLQQAGTSRLTLRFADPALEGRFSRWYSGSLWKVSNKHGGPCVCQGGCGVGGWSTRCAAGGRRTMPGGAFLRIMLRALRALRPLPAAAAPCPWAPMPRVASARRLRFPGPFCNKLNKCRARHAAMLAVLPAAAGCGIHGPDAALPRAALRFQHWLVSLVPPASLLLSRRLGLATWSYLLPLPALPAGLGCCQRAQGAHRLGGCCGEYGHLCLLPGGGQLFSFG